MFENAGENVPIPPSGRFSVVIGYVTESHRHHGQTQHTAVAHRGRETNRVQGDTRAGQVLGIGKSQFCLIHEGQSSRVEEGTFQSGRDGHVGSGQAVRLRPRIDEQLTSSGGAGAVGIPCE